MKKSAVVFLALFMVIPTVALARSDRDNHQRESQGRDFDNRGSLISTSISGDGSGLMSTVLDIIEDASSESESQASPFVPPGHDKHHEDPEGPPGHNKDHGPDGEGGRGHDKERDRRSDRDDRG